MSEVIKELACRFFINKPWYREIQSTTDSEKRKELIEKYKYDISIQLTDCHYWCADTKKYEWKYEYEKQLLDFLTINNEKISEFLEENKNHRWEWDVPISGLVIFNKKRTHIFAVRSIPKTNTKWGVLSFPKGKVKGGISLLDSAICEGLEEVGVDFSENIKDDPFIIYSNIKYTFYPAFSDLDIGFKAQPLFQGEIGESIWVHIDPNEKFFDNCIFEVLSKVISKDQMKQRINCLKGFKDKIISWSHDKYG